MHCFSIDGFIHFRISSVHLHLMKQTADVIAAIATPVAEGGLAVVRISGSNAIEVADASFRGGSVLKVAKSHTIHLGSIVDSRGRKIDHVLVSVFRAPNSYTGEDSVEVSCHGGVFISKRILECLLSSGARLADPGEFTMRAYLNGKMDLAQAEAISDLIRSQSESARRITLDQIDGILSHRIARLRSALLKVSTWLELEIDFGEEEYSQNSREEILRILGEVTTIVRKMIASYRTGRTVLLGAKVALIGSPNVGKSSVFNHLIDRNRAIVTRVPGTTRDVLEEEMVVNGLLFYLLDTAGIRDGADIVEAEGIRRSEEQIARSHIIINIKDLSCDTDINDSSHTEKILQNHYKMGRVIDVLNKIDLIDFTMHTRLRLGSENDSILVSAVSGFGMDYLRNIIAERTIQVMPSVGLESPVVFNLRHVECLRRSLEKLVNATEGLRNELSPEFVASELRSSIIDLECIIGVISSDELLADIFSSFCVGK